MPIRSPMLMGVLDSRPSNNPTDGGTSTITVDPRVKRAISSARSNRASSGERSMRRRYGDLGPDQLVEILDTMRAPIRTSRTVPKSVCKLHTSLSFRQNRLGTSRTLCPLTENNFPGTSMVFVKVALVGAVSYTHLTLPTICSV